MEKLRIFTVSSVTKPPVEVIRKKDEQVFACTVALPLPPQLLIFSQGQWPPGRDDKNATLDIYLDSTKIGEMDENTKCFTWETQSLESRPAGEKIPLEVKVMGMKTPSEQSAVPKSKKGAAQKKVGKKPASQGRKKSQEKEQPLIDISGKVNTESEKKEEDSVSGKTPEEPTSMNLPPNDSSSHSGKDKPEKKKNKKKQKDTGPLAATVDKKKSTPPSTGTKKTRQTQLNFSGMKKVSVAAETLKKDEEEEEADKNRTAPSQQASENGADATMETKLEGLEEKLDSTPRQTKGKDLEKEGLCEAQVLNENTPQADVHSPLPRKPVKRRRRNKDENSEGPTPKKRGTRMRALASEGTPKTSRTKSAVSDSPFKENVLTQVENNQAAVHSDGRLTRCIDLTARVPRPSARWGHTMLLTRPCRAVLIGGQGDRQQLSRDSVWTLHTETRKWQCEEVQSEGQKPENRMGHTATYDPTMRCVYIFGGSKNSRWFHDVHVYDLDENKWTLAKVDGKAPTRAYHTANLHRHELWIFGGVYPRPDPNPDGCSNEIHIFSPVMQTWYAPLVQGEKPLPRSGHSATLIKDRMVMFGGWDAPFCYNDLFILDLTTVDWSKPDVKGTPPKPRSWHASCALSNERILIHGGYDGNEALEDSFIFDLGGMSWSRLVVPNAPKARAGHAAVCVPYSHENQEEDEVLVFGGGDNDGEFFHDLLALTIPFNPVVEL
ncbi:uncharacterized protein LOC143295893 [Babylonia areolata]|uniref:uncharacterized protein LOC143295893 n=1 Tax=Babylonia areolata TaxID=304850 RepID=UPI003FD569AD